MVRHTRRKRRSARRQTSRTSYHAESGSHRLVKAKGTSEFTTSLVTNSSGFIVGGNNYVFVGNAPGVSNDVKNYAQGTALVTLGSFFRRFRYTRVRVYLAGVFKNTTIPFQGQVVAGFIPDPRATIPSSAGNVLDCDASGEATLTDGSGQRLLIDFDPRQKTQRDWLYTLEVAGGTVSTYRQIEYNCYGILAFAANSPALDYSTSYAYLSWAIDWELESFASTSEQLVASPYSDIMPSAGASADFGVRAGPCLGPEAFYQDAVAAAAEQASEQQSSTCGASRRVSIARTSVRSVDPYVVPAPARDYRPKERLMPYLASAAQVDEALVRLATALRPLLGGHAVSEAGSPDSPPGPAKGE